MSAATERATRPPLQLAFSAFVQSRVLAFCAVEPLGFEKLSSTQSEPSLLDICRAVHGAIFQSRADLPPNGVHRRARRANGRTDCVQRRRDARHASRTLAATARRGNVRPRSRHVLDLAW